MNKIMECSEPDETCTRLCYIHDFLINSLTELLYAYVFRKKLALGLLLYVLQEEVLHPQCLVIKASWYIAYLNKMTEVFFHYIFGTIFMMFVLGLFQSSSTFASVEASSTSGTVVYRGQHDESGSPRTPKSRLGNQERTSSASLEDSSMNLAEVGYCKELLSHLLQLIFKMKKDKRIMQRTCVCACLNIYIF